VTKTLKSNKESFEQYRISFGKRLFDIIFSLIVLIVLSPLLLLIVILIKLESKGPVLYISKRIGTGYDVFNFYKFRSMHLDADKEISKLSKMNEYLISHKKSGNLFANIEQCPECAKVEGNCSPLLYIDGI